MRRITAKPLTASEFAPFGSLFDLASGRPDVDRLLRNLRRETRLRLTISALDPAPAPYSIQTMERHCWSSQAFFPCAVARYLILVGPASAAPEPDVEAFRAFVVPGNVGIIYDAGVWHHPMRVLDRPGTFVVATFVDGTDADEEFRPIAGPLDLVLDDRIAGADPLRP